MPTRPILFYDGQCPLCRKEIAHYQRLDRQQRVDWQDLFAPESSPEHSPYYRHLAGVIDRLRLTRPLDWAYHRFAVWRFRSRCKQGCKLPPVKSRRTEV